MLPPRPAGRPVGRTGARSHTCNRHRARARLLAAAAAAGTRVFLGSADLHAAGFLYYTVRPISVRFSPVPRPETSAKHFPGGGGRRSIRIKLNCLPTYISTMVVSENNEVE